MSLERKKSDTKKGGGGHPLSMQAPDSSFSSRASIAPPNGDLYSEPYSIRQLESSTTLMDVDSNQTGPKDASHDRVFELESECSHLRRQLKKSEAKAKDVARLVTLYKEQSQGAP